MSRLVGVMRSTPVTCSRQIADRTRTEEVCSMSYPDSGSNRGGVKTLAIRLEPDIHAQLSLIAQLRGSTIPDEIRQALDAHIASSKTMPELAAQADSVLADIEREAKQRREAIATLFGDDTPTETAAPTPTSSRSRGRKAGGEQSSSES
jgi:predicted transcriptional regulator